MLVQLLGPVALYVEGQPQGLGSPKQRCAFAALALDCNRPMTADALVTRIWDEPTAKARENLISYFSSLRRRLRAAVGDRIRIGFDAGVYQLDVDPEAVDLCRFERFRRLAKVASNGDDDERAARLLHAAEVLGNGEALGGVSSDWMDRFRYSLEEERRAIRLDRIDCDLRLGRHAEVLGELQRERATQPLNERICAQLMKALYRCGRQTDALQAYREIRAALDKEHGVEPAAELRDLYQRLLDHDLELAVAPRGRALARHRRVNKLPADLPDFVGRSEALAAISEDDSASERIKLIVGMPGVGKTSLAVHAAHHLAQRYPDTQLYLDLSGHDEQRSPLTLARALNSLLHMIEVPAPRIPQELGERAVLWRREIAGLRALIVLDDPVDAEQIRPLIPSTGSCLILIASRRDLEISQKVRRIRLDVLPTGEARTLFARVAGCADDSQVEKVVLLCGLLPLSIRLNASRVHDGESIVHLIEQLRLGAPGLGASAREVRTAFEHSYRRLSPEQQTIFRRLSLHPGSRITADAAAALADQTTDRVRPALQTLRSHHLLEGADDEAYRFHDLLRSYTRELGLSEGSSSEKRHASQRLLHYYLASTERADSILHPHRPRPEVTDHATAAVMTSDAQARVWLESEWNNAVLMAEYAIDHEWLLKGARLAYLVAKFLEDRGLWEEESSILEKALRSARDINDRQCFAWISLELGLLCFLTGDSRAALAYANEALAVSRRCDHRTIADSHDEICIVQWSRGHYREALAHGNEALRIYQDINDLEGQAQALSHSGIACWHLGRYDDAKDHFEKALAIYRGHGDLRGEAKILNNIADVQLGRGYHRDAMAAYRRSQEIFNSIDGHRNRAILHSNMGNIYRYKGGSQKALSFYGKALATYRNTGDRRDLADTLNNMGMTYLQMGCHDDALASHEEALEIANEIDSPHERVRALIGIGSVYWTTLRYPLALAKLTAARGIAREIGDPYQEARVCNELAFVMLHTEGPDKARIYWRQALGIFEDLKVPEARFVAIQLDALG